jgi:hypothetical protein
MMNFRIPALAAALALAASGAALAQSTPMPMNMPMASPAPPNLTPTGPALTIKLLPQNGSGESGTATFTPVAGGTLVSIKITAGVADVPQPNHVHPGTCATLDPKPQYGLPPIKDGTSSAVIPASIADLLATPHAFNVHKSGPEAAIYVACGDIVKPK